MNKGRELHSYDYVNHPYERVSEAISKDAQAIFQSATKAAASRAQSVASQLRVEMGGIAVQADIKISVRNIEVKAPEAMTAPVTRLHLKWEAMTLPHLFPLMNAELSIYRLTATESQLEFKGFYQPPLGPLGKAVDAVIGHRIAEASVHQFVTDVAEHLRRTLG
jgi:hypothetical protein